MLQKTVCVLILGWFFTASAVSWAHEDVLTDPTAADQVKSPGSAGKELPPYDFQLGSRSEQIVESRALASTILTESAPRVTSKVFWKVLASLKAAPIEYPNEGYDFKGCTDRILAFVLSIAGVPQNRIYVCSRTMIEESPFIAQVLIHEAAHLRGYSSECDATKVEVGAMRHSGRGLVFRNGYMEKCGIE